MTRITLTNQFNIPITIYTCSINLTLTNIIFKNVTEYSKDNQTFLLDTNQVSEPFSVTDVYPFLIMIFTTDNVKYSVFDLCDFRQAGTDCNLNLINSKTSADVSLLYGYEYIKIENKNEVNVPIFMDDITSFIDENNCTDSSVKFGNINDEMLPVPTICIDQTILKTINTTNLKKKPKEDTKVSPSSTLPIPNISKFNDSKIKEIEEIDINDDEYNKNNKNKSNSNKSLQFSFYFIILLLIFVVLIWIYIY